MIDKREQKTLVVTRNPPARARHNTAFVATPLDLIATLEHDREHFVEHCEHAAVQRGARFGAEHEP